jgi:hypothetical protein
VTALAVRRLEFARAAWDTLVSGAVVLDVNGPQYFISMAWKPTAESWYLTLRQTSGAIIVSGTAVRDRTDCLMGVSTPGRPRGAIMSYDPKGRGDPTLQSFSMLGVGLYYVPAGIDPATFALYQTAVA